MERKFTAEITESHPDRPIEGSVSNRLVQYDDGMMPCYEVYEATWSAYDDGDCESGPHLAIELGMWECVCEGVGYTTLAEEIARLISLEGE